MLFIILKHSRRPNPECGLRLTWLGFEGVKVFALQLVEGGNDDRRMARGSEEFAGVRGEAELVGWAKLLRQSGHLVGEKRRMQRGWTLLVLLPVKHRLRWWCCNIRLRRMKAQASVRFRDMMRLWEQRQTRKGGVFWSSPWWCWGCYTVIGRDGPQIL